MGLRVQLTDQELAEIRVGDYWRLSVNLRVSEHTLAFYMIEGASQPLVFGQRVAVDK